MCNDIAIAADDTAYVSDTPNGRIFKIRPHVNKLELFAQDEQLKGIDGIVFSSSGQLYVNLVSTGLLFRVGIDKTGNFSGLTKITPSRGLEGPDGFRLLAGNSFLLAENKAGTIDRVIIKGDEAAVETLRWRSVVSRLQQWCAKAWSMEWNARSNMCEAPNIAAKIPARSK